MASVSLYRARVSVPYQFENLQDINIFVREMLDVKQRSVREYVYYHSYGDETEIVIRSKEAINCEHVNWESDIFECNDGDVFIIRMRCNPVTRENGYYEDLVGVEARKWFRNGLERHGAEIQKIRFSNVLPFMKSEGLKDIPVRSQSIVARVKVVNAESFIKLYSDGMGRRKNLGYGMLRCERVLDDVIRA